MKRFLRAPEAAEYLGLAPQTLARWRVEGQGPVHRAFGRAIAYAVEDLDAFADSRVRRSTSDTTPPKNPRQPVAA